jgi:chitinase
MITKAGVPAYMVIGSQALFGRSFQMTSTSCYGPLCTYTGPNSGAEVGTCTQNAGFLSNTEIYTIIGTPSRNPQLYSDNVYGDILVYDSNQWVSFLSPSSYEARKGAYEYGNFGGVADWVRFTSPLADCC